MILISINTLIKACEHDTDNNAVYLAEVAQLVSRNMMKKNRNKKNNSMTHLDPNVMKILCSFLLGISLYDVKWAKYQNTAEFLSSATASSHYFTATNAQQFVKTQGKLGY